MNGDTCTDPQLRKTQNKKKVMSCVGMCIDIYTYLNTSISA